ncbi:MAG: 2-phospho-L-lactate guanylyltransferase [Chloroflexi bacterium]|nr:2-phospho-L-lactate guanylyltransferase [Chloroflexota bacterium]
MNPTPPARIAAIIPVATFEDAKSRLGRTLDAEERQDLTERLLTETVEAALALPLLEDVLVVSPDRDVLRRAAELGARTLRQRSRGLNAGLDEGRADVVAGGADALLVLPIDLAFISAGAIANVLEPLAAAAHAVALVTDRHQTGTNALALRPPDVIGFSFGAGSRFAHRLAAEAAGARFVEIDGPLTLDIDTPADLVLVESMAPEGIGAG